MSTSALSWEVWSLFAGVDVNYRSEFMSAGDNDENDLIPEYTKVNARIGLGGERWEVMAYGRNIFDEAALQQSFDTPVLAGATPVHGRGCGVRCARYLALLSTF